jgi:hypothetical protein
MSKFSRLAIILFKGIGTAGQDPTLTVEQASDVSGTGAKSLTFTKIRTKQGAALTAIGQYTEVTQTAANTYTHATSAEEETIWVVEFEDWELDTANAFDCVRATVADVGGAAQLGCLLYVLIEPRHAAKPADLPSAIVN